MIVKSQVELLAALRKYTTATLEIEKATALRDERKLAADVEFAKQTQTHTAMRAAVYDGVKAFVDDNQEMFASLKSKDFGFAEIGYRKLGTKLELQSGWTLELCLAALKKMFKTEPKLLRLLIRTKEEIVDAALRKQDNKTREKCGLVLAGGGERFFINCYPDRLSGVAK